MYFASYSYHLYLYHNCSALVTKHNAQELAFLKREGNDIFICITWASKWCEEMSTHSPLGSSPLVNEDCNHAHTKGSWLRYCKWLASFQKLVFDPYYSTKYMKYINKPTWSFSIKSHNITIVGQCVSMIIFQNFLTVSSSIGGLLNMMYALRWW